MSKSARNQRIHQARQVAIPKSKPVVRSVEESEDEEPVPVIEEDEVDYEPKPKSAKDKVQVNRKVEAIVAVQSKSSKTSEANNDAPLGFVYLKTGRKPVYRTASLKYYTLTDKGAKTYLSGRVESGRLKVYDE